MTLSEIFDAVYGSNPSMAAFNTALAQIARMPADIYACWIEYKQARFGRV